MDNGELDGTIIYDQTDNKLQDDPDPATDQGGYQGEPLRPENTVPNTSNNTGFNDNTILMIAGGLLLFLGFRK